MRLLLILTQATLLVYGSPFFGWAERLDRFRFVCYGLMILYGFFVAGKFKWRRPQAIDFFAFVVLAYAFYSYTYSLDSNLTLQRAWMNLLLYLAIFWGLWICCSTPTETLNLLRILVAVWVAFYLTNMAFLYFHPSEVFALSHTDMTPGGYARFTGITSNPNAIGNFSAIILPLALWNYRQKRTLLRLAFLCATVLSFFLSFSRNAFICSVIGTSLYLYLTSKRHRPLLIVSSLFFIAFMIIYVDFLPQFLPEALVRHDSLDMLGGRTEAWEAALELIKKRPLLGYGFGMEDQLFQRYAYRFEHHSGAYAHNSFLGLALQLGWGAAILVFLAFIIFFIRGFFKLQRLRSESETLRTLTVALYASTLSAFSTSFFESWLYAAGGIIAFTFFTCLMFLMRLLDFEKTVVSRHKKDPKFA